MAERRWIKGEEILERWQAAPFELVDFILWGDLVAVDVESGSDVTPTYDRCLFCTKFLTHSDGETDPRLQPTICEIFTPEEAALSGFTKSNETPSAIFDDGRYVYYCRDVRNDSPGWEDVVKERVEFARMAFFSMNQVEELEQSIGWGPFPHSPQNGLALNETLRAAGITDAAMRARMINAAFELPLRELGAIMTGKPDDDGNSAANIKTAQRLLGKSK